MPNPPLRKPTRTALITGASSGIGEAAARALAREGYALALIARRKDRLDLLVKEIEEAGGLALAIAADLADDQATQRAAREAIDYLEGKLGRIDLLVNNAGYSPGAAIEQFSREGLRHIFDVNLLSALQLTGAVTPRMRAQGGGRIINVGSLAAVVPAPLAIPYGATKIAMHAATDALRLEIGRFGIDVSLIVVGFVDTAVYENARSGAQDLRSDPDNP
ncbi:SDR family NAD(P)-dependent oxidoreductase, partial [Myxococcota bacterium]|nr:SDR family NAD(P)-dependent oxidoreductase [Myxococcota bacterium]